MRIVLALTLVISTVARAQTSSDAPLKDPLTMGVKGGTVIRTDDTPVVVGPGCYLKEEVCMREGKERADLKAQVKSLKEDAGEMPTKWMIAAFIVGMVAGAGLTLWATHP